MQQDQQDSVVKRQSSRIVTDPKTYMIRAVICSAVGFFALVYLLVMYFETGNPPINFFDFLSSAPMYIALIVVVVIAFLMEFIFVMKYVKAKREQLNSKE